MKHSLRIIALLLTITFTSCNGNLNLINGIEGSGNVITEKKRLHHLYKNCCKHWN